MKLASRKQQFLGIERGVCAFQRTGDQNELSDSAEVLCDFPGRWLHTLHREKNLLTLHSLPYRMVPCLKDGVETTESCHSRIRQTMAKNISVITSVDQRLNPQYPVRWSLRQPWGGCGGPRKE